MRGRWLGVTSGAAVAAVLAAMLIVGCEDSPTDANGVILIDPPMLSVTNTPGNSWIIQLAAYVPTNCGRNLQLPLKWTMRDRTLGRFRDQAGVVVVYETVAAPGVQTITVRDQTDAEGLSTIIQNWDPGTP